MAESAYPYPLPKLEARIGHVFSDISLLQLALTHSSYANEMNSKGIECECNERLEFLGDSILSFITSSYLYHEYPTMPEGDLSKIRAGAVCEHTLHIFALDLELGAYLRLGRGEELTRGRSRPSILADAFEALLAAMFLDCGIDTVRDFLLPRIKPEIASIITEGRAEDHKTGLQQIIQQDKNDILEYVTVRESGPAHRRLFEVEARLNGNVAGRGSGLSKRQAEQAAALEALNLLGIKKG